jgi:hypothetical protein
MHGSIETKARIAIHSGLSPPAMASTLICGGCRPTCASSS